MPRPLSTPYKGSHPQNTNIVVTFIWFTKQSHNKAMNAEWWNYSDYEFRKENSVKIKLIDCLWNCMPNSCMEIRAIRLLVTTKINYKNCKGLRADYTHEETSRPENNKLAVTEIQIQSKF
jgi:hypothetical protein